MAFLASIKKRSDLRAKGVAREADDRDPTKVYDTPWIGELDPERFTKLPSGGKWMLFCSTTLVPMWRKCQKLYRQNELPGVSNMKISTANRYHQGSSGVIILYCGPTDDEENCKKIGRIILKQTGYTNFTKKMLYKTDAQTLNGKLGSHKYTLPIPQENYDNLKKQKQKEEQEKTINDSMNRPKPPKNLLQQINKKKKKKKKKKPFQTRVRTKDGKVFTETIADDGTITRKLEGQEVMPRYLAENDEKTKALPSYLYSEKDKRWIQRKQEDTNEDEKQKNDGEVKELVILSYNIWFADRQWKERQRKLLSMLADINPDIFCFQEVTPRFLHTFCANEYVQNNFELSDNKVANTVTPYGVFIGCNKTKNQLSMKQVRICHLYSNMGRRLLSAEIALNDQCLWVNTVHLESLLNKDVRIDQLKSIFNEHTAQQSNSMLMGDFNFGSFQPENDYISKDYVDCWKRHTLSQMNDGDDVVDDGLDAYRKMIQMGVPQAAIVHKMKKGGVSDDVINKYEVVNALPDGGVYAKLKRETGQTCGSQRYDRILLKSNVWKVNDFQIIGQPNMPSDHLGVVANIKRE
eukprot:68993_1